MIWKSFCRQFSHYAKEVYRVDAGDASCTEEAGVVDSGGQGLLEVLHGAYDAFLGKELITVPNKDKCRNKDDQSGCTAREADIKFGYCTEFIIMTDKAFTEADEMEF